MSELSKDSCSEQCSVSLLLFVLEVFIFEGDEKVTALLFFFFLPEGKTRFSDFNEKQMTQCWCTSFSLYYD